jgi:hypothetical protein
VHKGGINQKIPDVGQERQLLELGGLLVAESQELGRVLENSEEAAQGNQKPR